MRLADDGGGTDRSPARRGDWRERRPVKGNTAVHLVAAGGGVAGVAAGAAGVPALVALSGALAGSGAGAALVALLVLVVVGAVLGGAGGAFAQHGVRAWLRAPTEAERRAEQTIAAKAQRLDASDLNRDSEWGQRFAACRRSVEAFHELVRTVPEGRNRQWLTEIGGRLDAELAEALRLARLGQQLSPDGLGSHPQAADPQAADPQAADSQRGGNREGEPAGGETEQTAPERIAEQLRHAEADFAATVDRASAIAFEVAGDSDFQRVHAELDMLREQAPTLRAAEGD